MDQEYKPAKTARKSVPQWEYYTNFIVIIVLLEQMRYQCPFCNNTYKLKNSLFRHEIKKHKRPKCSRGEHRQAEKV